MIRAGLSLVFGVLSLLVSSCAEEGGARRRGDGGRVATDSGSRVDAGADALPPFDARAPLAVDSGAPLDAGALSDTGAADGARADAPGVVDASAPIGIAGYWVWEREVTDGVTTREITEADMMWRVGPSGWPGCPAGISCTRYGIRLWAFSSMGRAHAVHRVVTGSDYESPGTFTVTGDLLSHAQRETFSCAHPGGDDPDDPAVGYARIRLEGGRLWVSRGGRLVPELHDAVPGATPSSWIVYRPITQAEFHNRYDHPYCGAARDSVPACHPLCASQDVLHD